MKKKSADSKIEGTKYRKKRIREFK